MKVWKSRFKTLPNSKKTKMLPKTFIGGKISPNMVTLGWCNRKNT